MYEKFYKRGVKGAWRSCINDLLQPMPLKSRFLNRCSFVRQAPRSSHGFRHYHHRII